MKRVVGIVGVLLGSSAALAQDARGFASSPAYGQMARAIYSELPATAPMVRDISTKVRSALEETDAPIGQYYGNFAPFHQRMGWTQNLAADMFVWGMAESAAQISAYRIIHRAADARKEWIFYLFMVQKNGVSKLFVPLPSSAEPGLGDLLVEFDAANAVDSVHASDQPASGYSWSSADYSPPCDRMQGADRSACSLLEKISR